LLIGTAFWLTVAAAWSQPFVFSTLAGNAGYGSADGTNSTARLDFPQGIAINASGNVYVADTENSAIRKISPLGVVSTLAGVAGSPGSVDGSSSEARFDSPQGLAVDGWENVYIADTANGTIRKITPGGAVSTVAGSPGTFGNSNGINSLALFNLPGGVCADAATNLYVADTYNYTIRMLAPAGTNRVVTTLAGLAGASGTADGTNGIARFFLPSGIAVDANRNLYVADTGNNAVRKIALSGTNWVTTTLAHLTSPKSLTLDAAGNLYVANAAQNTIQKVTFTGTNWTVTTLAGLAGVAGSADGTNAARFNYPCGIAAATNGTLYVADSLNYTVRTVTFAGAVSTLAGLAGGPGTNDGSQAEARFNGPTGVTVDGARHVYVADTQNNTIRRVTPAGAVATLAGTDGLAGSSDGPGTNASFNLPAAIAVDPLTNIYVADSRNNEIRKLAFTGTNWIVTTLAGRAGTVYSGRITNVVSSFTNVSTVFTFTSLFTNYSGLLTNISGGITNFTVVITIVPFLTNLVNGKTETNRLATNIFNVPVDLSPQRDGIGTNALFYHPAGLALDFSGNLYVADGSTNGVRVIAPNSSVTTLAGSYGAYAVSPDVFGTNQLPYHSSGVAVDSAGAVYVADAGNNTIRLIAPGGAVTTIAGSPGFYGVADGTNDAARFASPVSLVVDARTNVFVADALNHTIRKITQVGADWVVTTVGGLAGASGSADGAGNAARFNNPSGMAIDNQGNLYVADTDNNTIRLGQVVVSEPVPLQFSRVGTQIVLSWPASASMFHVETSTNLGPGAFWLPVSTQPLPLGTNLVLTNNATAAAAFYRLRSP
jgi:sugar lactone lactonase YvrE